MHKKQNVWQEKLITWGKSKQLAEAVRMKNVRGNIKIRCMGKMHGEKLSRNWNL